MAAITRKVVAMIVGLLLWPWIVGLMLAASPHYGRYVEWVNANYYRVLFIDSGWNELQRYPRWFPTRFDPHSGWTIPPDDPPMWTLIMDTDRLELGTARGRWLRHLGVYQWGSTHVRARRGNSTTLRIIDHNGTEWLNGGQR